MNPAFLKRLEDFVVSFTTKHMDNFRCVVSFGGNQIEIFAGHMDSIEWKEYGEDVAKALDDNQLGEYFVHSYGPKMVCLHSTKTL